jgi:hypothetical protein
MGGHVRSRRRVQNVSSEFGTVGAAFLSAEFGFDGDVRHSGYIATWTAKALGLDVPLQLQQLADEVIE